MIMSEQVKISDPPNSAAGLKAITNAMKFAIQSISIGHNLKIFKKLNQKRGIDCPGCAWPDPDKRSKLGEFCENGAKAIAEEAMDKNAGIEFFRKHDISFLKDQSDYWLGQQGRLIDPMVKREGSNHYKPISWEDAFDLIGSTLKSLDNPDEAVSYTSGRASNEAAFMYQLFVRMFGTNNLPDCSNMCHESSGVALKNTVGIGKGSVTLEDFEHAEVILIFGQNPGTNHPRMLTALEKAKENGAIIISVNPIKEVGLVNFKNPQKISGVLGSGTDISDQYLQIKINEDVALLKLLMKNLITHEEKVGGILDNQFIESKTSGFKELKKDLEGYDEQELLHRTGLTFKEVESLVEVLANKKDIIACWAMGLTQHINAVDNIQEVVNLLLLKGSIGRKGAGTCPVRGHSNVQGDRTMGIWERPTKEWTDRLKNVFDFTPPASPGYNVVESIQAMNDGKVKVFMSLGGNFISAAPDTPFTSSAMKKCDLTVHISTKLNRSHLEHGKTALILPCLGRTDKHIEKSGEQFVTVENSMGVVHSSYGALVPRSKSLRSEPAIIAGIAHASLGSRKINWLELSDNYSKIRDLISKAIKGFEDYNEKMKQGGFDLPNGAREGIFHTDNQRANFTINKLNDGIKMGHEFIMMTIRSHDQFNTTIYGLDDRYRGIHNGRNVVFMNPVDIKLKDLHEGDFVRIENNYNQSREVKGFTVVPYDIPEGCVATYFPETNPLIPLHLHAKGSYTPASKSVGVNIFKDN